MRNKIFAITMLATILFVSVAIADNDVELEKIVVTSSRMAQHDYKVAGNVTVIKREAIAASNAQNIPDILKEALSVHVVNNSTAKTSTIDIRGFGDSAARNVLVLVNDRVLNTVDISAPDLLQIPLNSVERIEIIRGAGSVLYGDRAVGGVVNIITKKGKGKPQGYFDSNLGSYDKRSSALELSGSKNQFNYFLFSRYDDDHGYRENSDVLSKDFNTRIGYDLSDKLSADVDFSYHQDSYGLPGSISGANLSAMGPRATTRPNDFANTKDTNLKLGLDLKPWPENLYLGQLALNLYLRDRDVFDSFAGFDTSRTIKTTGVTAKYIFDHTVFNRELHFVTGADFYDTQNDIIGSGSNSDDLTISKADVGLFGFAEYEILKHAFMNGGLRYYKADYSFSQRNGVNVDERQHPDTLAYLGGAKYEYAKGSNVHASIQKTFRFLATDEWYSSFSGTLDTSLEQQKGLQYEVGIKHNLNDITTLNVTPYLIDTTDEIFFDPSTFTNSNYNRTRRAGVEVGQETDLAQFIHPSCLSRFLLSTNYTYQKPQFLGGANNGRLIPLVPRQQFGFGITTEFFKLYDLSFFGNYVGSQFAINDVSNVGVKVEPYATFDAKLALKRQSFEAYASINNIFNQSYSTYATYSSSSGAKNFYPEPGRNFTIGTKIKF